MLTGNRYRQWMETGTLFGVAYGLGQLWPFLSTIKKTARLPES